MNTDRGSGSVKANRGTSIFGPSSDGPSPAKKKRFGDSEDSPIINVNRTHGSFVNFEVADSQTVSRVLVTQSYKNSKIKKLKQEGRKIEYITVKSPTGCGNTGKTKIPAYYSHEATCNLNGKAVRAINREGETILCRHLAYSYVTRVFGRGKASFESINSTNKLENFEGIADDQLLNKTFHRKCPVYAYYFTLERFPEALAEIARQHRLADKTEKSYLFITTYHQMALRIKNRGDALKIIFYDPNDTLRHKSFILSQPDDANALSIDDFIGPAYKARYFLNKSDSGCCLMSVETSIKRDDSNVYYDGWNESLFYLSLKWGHYGHKDLLQISFVSCNGLTPAGKLKWFQTCHADGSPGLFIALENGHADAVKAFVDVVLCDNDLSQQEKFTLLEARRANGTPGLFMALQHGHADAVKAFVNAITGDNNLSQDEKFKLFQACRSDGAPGLFMALQKGHADVVKAFIDVIKGDNGLSQKEKFTLCQACSEDGIPGLCIAFQAGHADAVKAFIDASKGDTDLSQDEKFKLFQACRADGTSGLFMAIQNGHADVVKVFADAIMTDNDLSREDKSRLLQARNADGTPRPFVATHIGLTDMVKAFVDAIKSDNELPQGDSFTLFWN